MHFVYLFTCLLRCSLDKHFSCLFVFIYFAFVCCASVYARFRGLGRGDTQAPVNGCTENMPIYIVSRSRAFARRRFDIYLFIYCFWRPHRRTGSRSIPSWSGVCEIGMFFTCLVSFFSPKIFTLCF